MSESTGPCKICGRQPLKNFTWSVLEYLDLKILEYLEEQNQIEKHIFMFSHPHL